MEALQEHFENVVTNFNNEFELSQGQYTSYMSSIDEQCEKLRAQFETELNQYKSRIVNDLQRWKNDDEQTKEQFNGLVNECREFTDKTKTFKKMGSHIQNVVSDMCDNLLTLMNKLMSKNLEFISGEEMISDFGLQDIIGKIHLLNDPESDEQKQPKSGSAEQMQPQFGSAEQKQPQFGSAEQMQPQSGSAEQKQPQSGSAEQKQPQFGSAEQMQPQSGSAEQKQPQSGSAEQMQPQSGSAEQKQPQFGSAEQMQPQSGSAEQKQPQSGSAEQKQPQSGSAEQMQPQSKSAEQKQPQSGSAEQAQTQSGSAEQAQTQSGSAEQMQPQSRSAESGVSVLTQGAVGSSVSHQKEVNEGTSTDYQLSLNLAGWCILPKDITPTGITMYKPTEEITRVIITTKRQIYYSDNYKDFKLVNEFEVIYGLSCDQITGFVNVLCENSCFSLRVYTDIVNGTFIEEPIKSSLKPTVVTYNMIYYVKEKEIITFPVERSFRGRNIINQAGGRKYTINDMRLAVNDAQHMFLVSRDLCKIHMFCLKTGQVKDSLVLKPDTNKQDVQYSVKDIASLDKSNLLVLQKVKNTYYILHVRCSGKGFVGKPKILQDLNGMNIQDPRCICVTDDQVYVLGDNWIMGNLGNTSLCSINKIMKKLIPGDEK
ncbi:uncharacterized protein LOC141911316 [Tubulanus polymorphus]|uniref:uncharacterized protein LOC141911316 n=1 Tax=Tubulanus polymorphus TaxID=672921 RepID=UPI003DA6CAF8